MRYSLGSNEIAEGYEEILDIKGLDDSGDSDLYNCGRDAVPAPEVSLNIDSFFLQTDLKIT